MGVEASFEQLEIAKVVAAWERRSLVPIRGDARVVIACRTSTEAIARHVSAED